MARVGAKPQVPRSRLRGSRASIRQDALPSGNAASWLWSVDPMWNVLPDLLIFPETGGADFCEWWYSVVLGGR